ncbi:MAG: hypothetical protein AAF600_05415 [Bacteroidota bacterium]
MKLLKNILHYFLALVLLAATTGVTLNKHYCMGRLKSISVLQEAKSCLADHGRVCPKNCCEFEQEEYKVEDLNKVNHNYDFNPDVHLISSAEFAIILDTLFTPDTSTPDYLNYKPPLIEQNIPVQVQSFLL